MEVKFVNTGQNDRLQIRSVLLPTWGGDWNRNMKRAEDCLSPPLALVRIRFVVSRWARPQPITVGK